MKRNIIRAGLFILICGIWLGILTEVMKAKEMEGFGDVERKVRGFYAEDENSLDYIFFGSSRMYSALNPAILWKEYGITSYDFCCNEQGIPVTYYYMKEALERQQPKAVIVDISFGVGVVETREPMLHNNLDFCKISLNKLEAIWNNAEGIKRFDYLFPIRQWHNNWYNFKQKNFEYSFWKENNLYRGYSYVEPGESMDLPEYEYPYDMAENMAMYYSAPQPEVLKWIDKMVELAQEHGVELVFITVPDGTAPENQGYYNGVFRHVSGIDGVTCINYNLKMTGMHHLTSDLATEFTKMVGADLDGMFEVSDKRGQAGYESWDESVLIYTQEIKAGELNDITQWDDYVEWLKDDNYCIYIEQIPWICSDGIWEQMKKDLNEIGVKALSDSLSDYIGIMDMGEREKNKEYANEENAIIEERSGQMYYSLEVGSITINRQVFPCVSGLRIVVYDKKLGRVVDAVLIQDESLEMQRS